MGEMYLPLRGRETKFESSKFISCLHKRQVQVLTAIPHWALEMAGRPDMLDKIELFGSVIFSASVFVSKRIHCIIN